MMRVTGQFNPKSRKIKRAESGWGRYEIWPGGGGGVKKISGRERCHVDSSPMSNCFSSYRFLLDFYALSTNL